jgi:hypothetical protein
MTPIEKRAFIDELISNVHRDIVDRIPHMPSEWDGHEIRRYIADKFADSAMSLGSDKSFARAYPESRLRLILRGDRICHPSATADFDRKQ